MYFIDLDRDEQSKIKYNFLGNTANMAVPVEPLSMWSRLLSPRKKSVTSEPSSPFRKMLPSQLSAAPPTPSKSALFGLSFRDYNFTGTNRPVTSSLNKDLTVSFPSPSQIPQTPSDVALFGPSRHKHYNYSSMDESAESLSVEETPPSAAVDDGTVNAAGYSSSSAAAATTTAAFATPMKSSLKSTRPGGEASTSKAAHFGIPIDVQTRTLTSADRKSPPNEYKSIFNRFLVTQGLFSIEEKDGGNLLYLLYLL